MQVPMGTEAFREVRKGGCVKTPPLVYKVFKVRKVVKSKYYKIIDDCIGNQQLV